MNCRNCGIEIADKALICYRCGTATTAPRITPPSERPRPSPWPLILTLMALVVTAVLAYELVPDGPARYAALAGTAVAALAAVFFLRPGPRPGRRLRG